MQTSPVGEPESPNVTWLKSKCYTNQVLLYSLGRSYKLRPNLIRPKQELDSNPLCLYRLDFQTPIWISQHHETRPAGRFIWFNMEGKCQWMFQKNLINQFTIDDVDINAMEIKHGHFQKVCFHALINSEILVKTISRFHTCLHVTISWFDVYLCLQPYGFMIGIENSYLILVYKTGPMKHHAWPLFLPLC